MAGDYSADDAGTGGAAPDVRRVGRASPDAGTVRQRVLETPVPAATWLAVGVVLFALEAGAVSQFLLSLATDAVAAIPTTPLPGALVPPVTAAEDLLATLTGVAGDVPTLLSRETIPNAGHWDGSRYVGTFLGLSPMAAWGLRVALIYAYALAVALWAWEGYRRYRRHYRVADWSPRDDVIDRLRTHYWGLFGFAVVFAFVVMAVFAPALGPTTVDRNIANPYSNDVTYWTGEEVDTVTVGSANTRSTSTGSTNVGPMTYDDFGRFHPFGTLPSGKDLFTFIAAGARVSLVIGLLSVGLSGGIAAAFALLSAYYKGAVDLGFVLTSDAVMALPQLLLLIMLTVVLANTWIGDLYDGAFVLALIFAGTGWPYMWRSLRGPALVVSERAWIDAARSFGQTPGRIMRTHMFPYVVGYLLVYGSMTLGGAIIAIAGLSFLGLGVNPPTPEWGRAVNAGQEYVGTASWHISFVPGVLITLVVTGFNAFGDGVRDAIDPESDGATGEAAGRGGGA